MLSKDASVLLVYKNFAASKQISHIGLGVAALNNAKVLRQAGIKADVESIVSADAIRNALNAQKRSHVVISAPWLPTADLQTLVTEYRDTEFFIVSHSNVGFLQADRNGTRLLREAMELETGTHNFHLAGNSRKFAEWVRRAFQVPCVALVNMYYLESSAPKRGPAWSPGQPLRIGAFGATRPLKNLMSACGAALEIAKEFRSALEIWVSAGRTEAGGHTVLDAIREMLARVPGVTLIPNGWQSWPAFRKTVGYMHLLLQPSYTESFNMVTADGVAEGVASVVSAAIPWAPRSWVAEADDVCEIARVGKQLLMDRDAVSDGLEALVAHNRNGLADWAGALGVNDCAAYAVGR